jgi:outer membrane lipoprotein-sorting protein
VNKRWQWVAGVTVLLCVFVSPAFCATELTLDSVLAKLDETAAKFRSAQADFTWTTYNSVINDVDDKQTGRIYFQRKGTETRMAADINPPEEKQVVFSGGQIQIYQPGTGVKVYDASTHREEFETFLVLGFGSSGEDIRKSFDVKYDGEEKSGVAETAKLELTPKSENIRNHFPKIELWIDPGLGISVKQKLYETNGSYRLAEYSKITLDQKIPDKVFKLKTSGRVSGGSH